MAATKKTAKAKKVPDRRNPDKRVRDLAKLLEDTGLSEIEIEENGTRIRVAKGGATFAATAAPAAAPAPTPVAAAPAGTGEAAPAEVSPENHPGALKSPLVGTAYVSAEPNAAPFVKVGDQVSSGQTVFIVEAMKVMNAIPAHKAGKVSQILVADAEPVEFGQPLLIIE